MLVDDINQFSTFVFEENEVKTKNKKVIRERTFYLGVLTSLVGFLLIELEIEYGGIMIVVGFFLTILGRFIRSGKESSIGHRPLPLLLRRDSFVLGNDEIEIMNKSAVSINVVGYSKEKKYSSSALSASHSGNANTITFPYNGREIILRFVLESERHKEKLLQFCSLNGYEIQKRTFKWKTVLDTLLGN
jgi:uncharacterized membrane protein